MSKREGKTEKPTEKKRRDAKRKGTIAKSQDVGPWLTMLAATYAIPATVRGTASVVVAALQSTREVSERSDPQAAVHILGNALSGGLTAVMPLLLVTLGVGLLGHFAQAGLTVSFHRLKPDFKRVNPVMGLKNLLSTKSLWQTAKQVMKSIVIGWLCWPHVQAISEELGEAGRVGVLVGLGRTAQELMGMVRVVCWAVLVIAAADYVVQRREKMTQLLMTKQEVRDESKNSEGNPEIKARVRSMQVALARGRMMGAIAGASVVVTNPTHIAVAITYAPSSGGAPKVVAIGVDATAAKIRERAREAGVPIVESVPLARALWRTCELGDEIPVVLYEAVAKVLAFVRRLKGGLMSGSLSALPLPRAYAVDRGMLDALPARSRRKARQSAIAPAA